MHCNLKYPTMNNEINLGMIKDIKINFPSHVIGLSDHTMNTLTPALAYMLGARVFEKHFTIDKGLDKSADHWLSADVEELKEIVKNTYLAKEMYGDEIKRCSQSEEKTKNLARRSIVANCDIKKGDIFTNENLSCKRPGTGLPPSMYKDIIGKYVKRNLKEDEFIKREDIN